MEGLETGWVKSDISETFHFMQHVVNVDGFLRGRCGFLSRNPKEFYKKYEILDTSKICVKCELIIKTTRDNVKKKKEFLSHMEPIKLRPNTHILKAVVCSEPGCNETGAAFVSTTQLEKEHYCLKHNVLVQYTLEKEIVV